MSRFDHDIIVDASAERVWQVLGLQFGDIGQWTSVVASTSISGELGVGAKRVCHLSPSSTVSEELTEYSPETMSYAYRAGAGVPGWVKEASNHWTIQPIDEKHCRVLIRPTIRLSWWANPIKPFCVWSTRRLLVRVGEELKHYVEKGEVHPRKIEQTAKLAASAA